MISNKFGLNLETVFSYILPVLARWRVAGEHQGAYAAAVLGAVGLDMAGGAVFANALVQLW